LELVAAEPAALEVAAALALGAPLGLAAGEDDALVPTDEMPAPCRVFGRPIIWKSLARFGLELDEPDDSLMRTTRPGKFRLRPVAVVLVVSNAGFTLSIAGPLPFAVMSTVQPLPSTPAFMPDCGTFTWRSMYLFAVEPDALAEAGADAATDPVARADAAADPLAKGELDALFAVWLQATRAMRENARSGAKDLFMNAW
jgi:hypothetical protein